MKTFIEIIPSVKESRIPFIKLSKSKEGKTGSATFLFTKPQAFQKKILGNSTIKSIKLVYKNQEISSNLIELFFKEGKPFSLKAIFIFTTKKEYFSFFKFLILYSKENNLTYLKDFSI